MICSRVTPVQPDAGDRIATRALLLIGTPFRLHGRCPAAGLDCVGLAAAALDIADVPCEYSLRGDHGGRVAAFFDCGDFRAIKDGVHAPGDILLLSPAVRQSHLAVMAYGGAVHAHAGLRRVVFTPLPLPWLIKGHWRSAF